MEHKADNKDSADLGNGISGAAFEVGWVGGTTWTLHTRWGCS